MTRWVGFGGDVAPKAPSTRVRGKPLAARAANPVPRPSPPPVPPRTPDQRFDGRGEKTGFAHAARVAGNILLVIILSPLLFTLKYAVIFFGIWALTAKGSQETTYALIALALSLTAWWFSGRKLWRTLARLIRPRHQGAATRAAS